MNPNQQQTAQNPAQYMPQYAGYMPPMPAAGQTGFYPAAYPAYSAAYPAYPVGTMDPQYMGYYGMTGTLPTSTAVPTSQAPSTSNQVRYFLGKYYYACII